MRRIVLTLGLLSFLALQQGVAWSTPGWLVLNQKTIEGTWVSLDQGTGEVCRLQIRGTMALLVIAAGSPGLTQSEYVFRSSNLVVKNGRFSARMAEQRSGMIMDVVGEGQADSTGGVMDLQMGTLKTDYPPWGERTASFVKECCGSISEVLIRNDKRARELLEGAAKVDERKAPALRTQRRADAPVPRSPKKSPDAGESSESPHRR